MAKKKAKAAKRSTPRRSARGRRKLRIGFIGVGAISDLQISTLKEMPDAEVVAGADVNTKSLDNAREKHGIEHVFESWKAMLKQVPLDAISVCTPNGLHMQPTIDALNAGCHVLVEKPMAMNARQGQKMIDAAKKNRRHLIIGFQHRFSSEVQMLKRAADAGQFGKILYMRCQAVRRRGIPNWGVFGRKELQGGGPLIDIGVHCMEQAHYLMGSPRPVAATGNIFTYMGDRPSKTISPWASWDWKTYTVEDLAVGHIRFENGAVMHTEAAFACHGPDSGMTFQFKGEKGGGGNDPPTIYTDLHDHMMNITPHWLPTSDFKTMFQSKLRKFVDTALYNKPTEAPAEHGLMVQKMLDGIYRSAELGREVKIG